MSLKNATPDLSGKISIGSDRNQGRLTEGEGSVQLTSSLSCKEVNHIFNVKMS